LLSVFLSGLNIVGGFAVTSKMLAMFEGSDKSGEQQLPKRQEVPEPAE